MLSGLPQPEGDAVTPVLLMQEAGLDSGVKAQNALPATEDASGPGPGVVTVAQGQDGLPATEEDASLFLSTVYQSSLDTVPLFQDDAEYSLSDAGYDLKGAGFSAHGLSSLMNLNIRGIATLTWPQLEALVHQYFANGEAAGGGAPDDTAAATSHHHDLISNGNFNPGHPVTDAAVDFRASAEEAFEYYGYQDYSDKFHDNLSALETSEAYDNYDYPYSSTNKELEVKPAKGQPINRRLLRGKKHDITGVGN